MNYRTSNRLRRKSGFTLVELAVVLAVIATLAVVVISERGSTEESGDVYKLSRQIDNLVTAVEDSYSSQGGLYPGLDNDVVYDQVPENIRGASSPDLGHTWDATGFTVSAINSDEDFALDIDSLPAGVCESVANRYLDSVQSISVDGTPVANPADVASNCSGDSTTVRLVRR